MLKPLHNFSEQQISNVLKDICSRFNVTVESKRQLSQIFQIERSGISDELFSFALKSHFDFVLYDEQQPILAIESDGPTHQESVQITRDRMKDHLCAKFGLSLKRFHPTDFQDGPEMINRITVFLTDWLHQRQIQKPKFEKSRCPLCGDRLILATGYYGDFLSCISRPKCLGSRRLPKQEGPPPLPVPKPPSESIVKDRPIPIATLLPDVEDKLISAADSLDDSRQKHRPKLFFSARVIFLLVVAFTIMSTATAIIVNKTLLTSNKPLNRDIVSTDDSKLSVQKPIDTNGAQTSIQEYKNHELNGKNDIKIESEINKSFEPATTAQMKFLDSLIAKRNFTVVERNDFIVATLGYFRNYDKLSKQDASKLITALDNRKRSN